MADEWRLSEECAAEFRRREAWEELTNPAGKTPLYHADSSARCSDRLSAWLAASSVSLLPGGAAPPDGPASSRGASPPPRSQASSSTPEAGWDRLVAQQEAEQLQGASPPPPPAAAAAAAQASLPPPGLGPHAAPPELEPTPADARLLSPSGKRRGRRKRGGRRHGPPQGQPEAGAQPPPAAPQPPTTSRPPCQRTWPLRDIVADQPWVKTWQPVPSSEALGWPEVERWGNDWAAADPGDGGPATLEPNAFLQAGYWTRDG